MTLKIRLTRNLYEELKEDLLRPHLFASERVGFLSAKIGNNSGDTLLVIFTDYHPLPDDAYIDDPFSGARIDSLAIREALQRSIDRNIGTFHVHLHQHRGKPTFSHMDQKEIPDLVKSFRTLQPQLTHGMFLLSEDNCNARVWIPASELPISPNLISIVGFPMNLF